MAAHDSSCDFRGDKAERLALAKFREVLRQGRVWIAASSFGLQQQHPSVAGVTQVSIVPSHSKIGKLDIAFQDYLFGG